MSEILRVMQKIGMLVLLYPLRLFRIKNNRVLLYNNLGFKYSDNPKYVAEYLLNNYKNVFEIIYPINHPDKYRYLREKGMTTVKINSLQYFYYAMTSKVFLTNSGGVSFLPLRKSQYVINTWHGGGAYKKAGTDMYNNSRVFRWDLKLRAKKTNKFVSTNKRFSKELSRALLTPREVFWEIGMPKSDVLINRDAMHQKEIRQKIGLAEDEKLVLFAPTYRKIDDNYFNDSVAISYGIDCDRVCKALSKRFGGKWRFAFRLHPMITNRDALPTGEIIDLSDYEDMQELLLAADAMINDFSSTFWDYLLTEKPCFLFAVDLWHYIETTEVYTPIAEWPFLKAVNNDELEKNILSFDMDKYLHGCKKHYEALGGCETGKATQLICAWIYGKCFPKAKQDRGN